MVHPFENRRAPIPRFPVRIDRNRFALLVEVIGI
jgi:hypothetical protein